jgi:hypothetical protein
MVALRPVRLLANARVVAQRASASPDCRAKRHIIFSDRRCCRPDTGTDKRALAVTLYATGQGQGGEG